MKFNPALTADGRPTFPTEAIFGTEDFDRGFGLQPNRLLVYRLHKPNRR